MQGALEHQDKGLLVEQVTMLTAAQQAEEAPVEEVVVTNTIPIPDEKRFDRLTVLSIAPIVAEALDAVFEDTSVSELFRGDNV